MKWLTQKEVKEAGKKSKKAAIRCSIEHWQQIVDATWEELEKKIQLGGGVASSSLVHVPYCALCQRYYKRGTCRLCPLALAMGHKCNDTGSLWRRASRRFMLLCKNRHKGFEIAAKNLLAALKKLDK